MSNKIKLAFFAEILIEDFDGASRTIFNIIHSIPTDRFDVIFFCGVPPKGDFKFPYFVVPTVGIPFNKDYRMAIPQLVLFQLKYKLLDFNPDIIHISTPSLLGKFALNFAKKHHIKVSTIYHTHFISYIDYYLEKIPPLISPIKNWVIKNQKAFYEKCDVAYIPSKNMIKDLENHGISSSNFKIWPRGVHTERFTPSKRDVAKMKRITGNDHKNIIFASRLVWEKNLKTLIKIYEKSQSFHINFIIAGDGVAKENLMKLLPNAFFLGHLSHEELAVVYASCDVFLFTSISETYGNVVAEAMASGLPCVIANGGGSAHFVDHGVSGFLCDPENSEEYIENILLLLENQDLSSAFIAKGLEHTAGLKWEKLTASYFTDISLLSKRKEEQKFVPAEFNFSY